MEEWKKLVLVGFILIVLAVMFAIAKKGISIWTVLILIIAIADIILGLYRKKREI